MTDSGIDPSDPVHQKIYEEDAANSRHNHVLMWSCIQLVTLIEGAILFGQFSVEVPDNHKRNLISIGTVLIVCITVLMWRHYMTSNRFLERMVEYEKAAMRVLPSQPKLKGLGFWTAVAGIVFAIAVNLIVIL